MYEVEEEQKWSEISNSLKKVLKSKTRDEWFELLADKDIPVGKVLSLSEVLSDPHISQQKMIIEAKHPTQGKIRQIGTPIRLSKTKARIGFTSPRFGEHTKGTLRELGYSKKEIEVFIKNGIVH
jgi:formyl-CoA transferase/CoA:oxalate CoA-transferase